MRPRAAKSMLESFLNGVTIATPVPLNFLVSFIIDKLN
jgi:hypothetical protein